MKNKPAFPQSIFIQAQEGQFASAEAPLGMTLREYYAGLAMQALIDKFGTMRPFSVLAQRAIESADALIVELENSGGDDVES